MEYNKKEIGDKTNVAVFAIIMISTEAADPGGRGGGHSAPPPFQVPKKCPFFHRKSAPLTL